MVSIQERFQIKSGYCGACTVSCLNEKLTAMSFILFVCPVHVLNKTLDNQNSCKSGLREPLKCSFTQSFNSKYSNRFDNMSVSE